MSDADARPEPGKVRVEIPFPGTASASARFRDAKGTVIKRVAEYHLTVLADRTESGEILLRLVDESDAEDLVGLYIEGDESVALDLVIDVARLIGGSA